MDGDIDELKLTLCSSYLCQLDMAPSICKGPRVEELGMSVCLWACPWGLVLITNWSRGPIHTGHCGAAPSLDR